MSRIFISYRRSDSIDVVGRIHDRLADEFGSDQIFIDVDAIPVGVDFKAHIRSIVDRAEVVLVVIGRDWLTTTDSAGERRLDSPDDFVRLEIESALRDDKVVIPVLIRGAEFPSPDDLPESLRELTYRNGLPIRPDPDFQVDIHRLISSLHGILKNDPWIPRSSPRKIVGYKPVVVRLILMLVLLSILAVTFPTAIKIWPTIDNFFDGNFLGLVSLTLFSSLVGGLAVLFYTNIDSSRQLFVPKTVPIVETPVDVTNNDNESISVVSEFDPKIFISYKRIPNAMHANYLELGLEMKGVQVFMDISQQDGALRFPDRLLKEIESSDIFVCLLSNQTYESDWVLKEISHAHKLMKPMIPIFTESFKDWLRDDDRSKIFSILAENGYLEAVEYLEQHQAVHFYDHDNQYIRYAINDIYKLIASTKRA